MTRRLSLLGIVGVLALGLMAPVVSAPAHAAPTVEVATWEMNESAGAQVMVDSSGNGLNGQISPDAASQGLTSNGQFYSWEQRCPACPPVQQGRVVQVPDDDRLDVPDPNATYTLEFRFRTTHGYGNYMQKGQSTTKGGQIKVQGPGGRVQCLFKGADGTRVGTGSQTPLDDGQWHTVACVHTATQVRQYVDGVHIATNNGVTGPINNARTFNVGGKSNCDQNTITCDYFSGDIDYIRVTTEGGSTNTPPTAMFSSSCDGASCSFNSSGTTDPDGTVEAYRWTFGDGGTSTQVNPTHTYSTSGAYQVTLTVTDNGGATGSTTHGVTIDPLPPSPPRDATAKKGDSLATVTWRAPKSSGSDPIAQYRVTSTPDGKFCMTSNLKCKVKGLSNGRSYTFRVVALSDAGASAASNPTNAVRPAGVPGRVKDAKAKSLHKAARVTWDASATNGARIQKYRVVTAGGKHRVVDGDVLKVRFGNLKVGSSQKFRVRAINSQGAGPWSKWTRRVTIG